MRLNLKSPIQLIVFITLCILICLSSSVLAKSKDNSIKKNQATSKSIHLNFRPQSVEINRHKYFNDDGQMRNSNNHMYVRIKSDVPSKINPMAYKILNAKITTKSGKHITPSFSSSINKINNDSSISINFNIENPGKITKISKLQGKIKLYVADGKLRKATLSPIKKYIDKKIGLKGIGEGSWIKITRTDFNPSYKRIKLYFDKNSFNKLKKVIFKSSHGANIKPQYSGGGVRTSIAHIYYHVDLPKYGKINLYFYPKLKAITVPFEVKNIITPKAKQTTNIKIKTFEVDASNNKTKKSNSKEIHLNFHTNNFRLNRNVYFNKYGNVRSINDEMYISIKAKIPSKLHANFYKTLNANIITGSGRKINLKSSTNRRNIRRNGNIDISFHANKPGKVKKIPKMQGNIKLYVADGKLRKATLAPIKKFIGKNVKLEGLGNDAWVRFTSSGSSSNRVKLAFDKPTFYKFHKVVFKDSDGNKITARYGGEGQGYYYYNVDLPKNGKMSLQFFSKLELVTVPFEIKNVLKPSSNKAEIEVETTVANSSSKKEE